MFEVTVNCLSNTRPLNGLLSSLTHTSSDRIRFLIFFSV